LPEVVGVAVKNRLKEIIDERGIKQTWLRERAGMSHSAFNRIVNGLSLPTLEAALRIAKALDLHVEDIWALEE
jgi:putative transcriptional regulator